MSSRPGPSRAGKSGLSRISDMAKILKMDAGIIRYVANLAGIGIVRADNGINKAVRAEDRERLKMICIKFKEQMAIMTQGTSTGVLDELLSPICVGDEIVDKAGTHYTIDRFGRAKPTSGRNEVPIKMLEGVTICKSWAGHAESITKAATQPEPKKELPPLSQEEPAPKELDPGPLKGFNPGDTSVHDAPDQMLADELRRRGYEVTATKTTIVAL